VKDRAGSGPRRWPIAWKAKLSCRGAEAAKARVPPSMQGLLQRMAEARPSSSGAQVRGATWDASNKRARSGSVSTTSRSVIEVHVSGWLGKARIALGPMDERSGPGLPYHSIAAPAPRNSSHCQQGDHDTLTTARRGLKMASHGLQTARTTGIPRSRGQERKQQGADRVQRRQQGLDPQLSPAIAAWSGSPAAGIDRKTL